jgi:peptidylprolyl isomerase
MLAWRGVILAGAMVLGAAAPAVGAEPPLAGGTVLAQRGDVTFTAADLRQMLDMASPADREAWLHDPALLAQQVRDRVLQRVVVRAAHQAGWDTRPQVVYQAELARDSVIAESFMASEVPLPPGFPSEADLQTAYNLNRDKFTVPQQFHLAQIVVDVPPNASDAAAADARKQAQALRQKIATGGDFAVLARQNSTDKALADSGGELGWRREDGIPPEVRTALTQMRPGDVSQPIRLPDGWHIVKLLGTRPAGIAGFDEVRDNLARAMRQQQTLQNQRRYVLGLLQAQPLTMDPNTIARAAATAGGAQ